MLWRRNKPKWIIDPSKVAFGAVVGPGRQNLNRSHVRVKYRKALIPQYVPVAAFIRGCWETIRGGASLDIEHLLVAPILKRRYARFFDLLTDWTPATRRSLRPRSGRPTVRDP